VTKVLFLPGAGGSAAFWDPVAVRLSLDRRTRLFSWPGLGSEPHDPNVRGIDDLVSMVRSEIEEPVDIVAQSMGALVAIRIALEHPEEVRRLVLVAASAGVPVAGLGGSDWRGDYRRSYPKASTWITDVHVDRSARLGAIGAPTLLLWGDSDPISPPAVGRRPLSLLPNAAFHIIIGGDHDMARTHADEVARRIAGHLR
jgi:pimeloyl-ACP methyl ester carboxylesterase